MAGLILDRSDSLDVPEIPTRYSVLIRTFNSGRTLPDTLQSLADQTIRPAQYVVVDSGSTDRTMDLIPDGAVLQKYMGSEFNFSAALNQGIHHVSFEFVLIISSHTLLQDRRAIEYALDILRSNGQVGATCFGLESTGQLRHSLIDTTSFNGFNGLWNTCSLVRTDLLRQRPFRPEVFSAEDQEWTRWLLHHKQGVVARIEGAGMDNSRNAAGERFSRSKRLNEYVSIAYFTNRRLLGPLNLARIIYRALKPVPFVSLQDRYFHLMLFMRLVACHFVMPKYKSKYF